MESPIDDYKEYPTHWNIRQNIADCYFSGKAFCILPSENQKSYFHWWRMKIFTSGGQEVENNVMLHWNQHIDFLFYI